MIRVGEPVNFDIVIVGAGTAGCAVAAQLARCTDHSIGIVEAGTRYPAWALHAPLAGLRLRPFWSWRHESVPIPGLAARRIVFPTAASRASWRPSASPPPPTRACSRGSVTTPSIR